MGTRVVYQIMGEIDGEKKPLCILYSNSSHATEDPQDVFRNVVENSIGPTSAVEMLLSQRYEEASGNHMPDDRMFNIVTEPFGDYEFSLAIDYDADEPKVYRIDPEETPSPSV